MHRKSKSTRSPGTKSTLQRAASSFAETARCAFSIHQLHIISLKIPPQVFRFANSKNESLFLQRKNPRKIAWTQVYRRMHKKGLTEEVARKRSRKTVKHQRGIVGADLAAIAARRNQTAAVRAQARQTAIAKAKEEKKAKEAKKEKTKVRCVFFLMTGYV
jgi:hypothetical protein